MPFCQRWYSCWKHRWKILAGRSRMTSLVAVMTFSEQWNLRPRRIAIIRGKRKKNACARSGEHGERGKTVTSCLASFSRSRQRNMQGRCRVAIANSFYAKAQVAYSELNRVNGQGSICSGFYLHFHLLGWIPSEQFHFNKKTVQSWPCLCPALSEFFLSWW